MPAMHTDAHVLVVDDSADIRDGLIDYLRANGYRATGAASAAAARAMLKQQSFDLAVLDVMMPGEDGLSLCRSLVETGDMPVIMLSARGSDIDRIVGLEIGADDYVAKPFQPRELLARIAAVLRRAEALPRRMRPAAEANRFRFEGILLDAGQREITGPDGIARPLSAGEFALLMAFISRPRVALSRDALLDLSRGRHAEATDRAIDNLVMRLRRKIEPDPKTPRLIKTVWGGGYLFAAEVERIP